MKRAHLFILSFFFMTLGFTQEKKEVEKRIKESEVHEDAIEWLEDAYENKRKTKWYYQTDGDEEVFEAKLKYKKHLHSVEFNLKGEVQNVEVLLKEKEMDKAVHQNITGYLENNYNKYSFSKIQIKYTGEEDDLEDMIDENEFEDITINYEIEYYGKTDSEDELWEGIFNENGMFLEKRVVKIKATDNLDY